MHGLVLRFYPFYRDSQLVYELIMKIEIFPCSYYIQPLVTPFFVENLNNLFNIRSQGIKIVVFRSCYYFLKFLWFLQIYPIATTLKPRFAPLFLKFFKNEFDFLNQRMKIPLTGKFH